MSALPISGQSHDQTKPEFEVASIKRNSNCGVGAARGLRGPLPGRFDVECTKLEYIIQTAYGAFGNVPNPNAKPLQILGAPEWILSDDYDIHAKADGNPPISEMYGPMLRALLEARFRLRLHREKREMPVYALTVARGGSRLLATKPGSCIPRDLNRSASAQPQSPSMLCGYGTGKMAGPNVVIDVHGVGIGSWAEGFLSSKVDRPVIDHTGLSGLFDIHLEFAPDLAVPAFQARSDSG